jgi:V/A-type H+/Na+-transporting ATPase subunit I
MIFPQAMTEIELIVPTRDLLAVTQVLSREGIFQQADSSTLGLNNDAGGRKKDGTWNERAAAYASLERRIQTTMQALGIDEGYPPKADFEGLVDLDTIRPTIEQSEQAVKNVSDQLSDLHKQHEQMESILSQMEPVKDVDLDISMMRNPRYLFSVLGTMPNENMDRMQTSLSRVPHVFLVLRPDAHRPVVWLAGSMKNSDILDRAARSAYLNPVSLPDDYQGTPEQIISTLRENMRRTDERIANLEKEITRLCETHEKPLQTLLWNIRSSRLLADAIVRFGKLQYTYLIVGWVITAHMEDLVQRIKQVSKETLIQTSPLKRGEGRGNVPVSLKNPRFLRPFQSLVTTYARPTYNELDPTFLIAITFPLLFGAMFGDLGQGLVLVGLGWLLSSKKVKALRSMAGLGGLIMVCGLFAAVFGILYGSFFGFEGKPIHALWLAPLENIMTLLILAIGAGVVLLISGFLIGMFNAFVSRDWGHLFFDRNGIAGFVLYITLILLVVGVFTKRTLLPMPVAIVLLVVSGLAIMFSEVLKRLVEGHRPLITEGIATYGIQAFFELFETLISFLSNSLSYVRVGAFAVAHAGLSQVIFILAGLAGPAYWPVVILGNIFIIGFEGLIVGIQTMRLEYYEFFSKFFKGGGNRYEPLTLRPNETEQA